MNVSSGWSQGGSGAGVKIGFIDSGVIGTETDLSGKVDTGFNQVRNRAGGNTDQTPGTNPFYHGTFCATCASALTNNGTLGSAPAYAASIYPVNVFDKNSTCSDSTVLNALFWLEGKGVKLVNLSVNASVPYTFATRSIHPALSQAFDDFYLNQGGLLFNAAGNDGLEDKGATSRSNSLICISSVTSNSTLSSFSTFGAPVWFAAPGSNIVSGSGTNSIQTASGTSFACPLALSVAAQIWGLRPNLSNATVLSIMQQTAIQPPGYTQSTMGYGIVNSGGAVQKALTF